MSTLATLFSPEECKIMLFFFLNVHHPCDSFITIVCPIDDIKCTACKPAVKTYNFASIQAENLSDPIFAVG